MPVWRPLARDWLFLLLRRTEEMGEIGDEMDPAEIKERENLTDSADWLKFYEDLVEDAK